MCGPHARFGEKLELDSHCSLQEHTHPTPLKQQQWRSRSRLQTLSPQVSLHLASLEVAGQEPAEGAVPAAPPPASLPRCEASASKGQAVCPMLQAHL